MITRFLVRDHAPEQGALWQLFEDLYQAHDGNYTYQMVDEYLQAKILLKQILNGMLRLFSIALLQLLVVSLSSAGILYLFLQRRKADIAISVMMGSTMKGQGVELLGEATFLVLLGFILSLVSYGLLGSFTEVNPLQFKKLGSMILVLLLVVFTSTSLALGELSRLSPVEILQKK